MPAALEISSLQKTYANGFEALKGIDLNVQEGDFYALLGPMAPVNRQPSALSVRWFQVRWESSYLRHRYR